MACPMTAFAPCHTAWVISRCKRMPRDPWHTSFFIEHVGGHPMNCLSWRTPWDSSWCTIELIYNVGMYQEPHHGMPHDLYRGSVNPMDSRRGLPMTYPTGGLMSRPKGHHEAPHGIRALLGFPTGYPMEHISWDNGSSVLHRMVYPMVHCAVLRGAHH